jgi:GTP cyclohydrolase I
VDEESIASAIHDILKAIGEDPNRPGLARTPRRIARMYRELFAGVHFDPRQILRESVDESHDEMVIVRDIPFYSLCEHHLLPFYGIAHVGYVNGMSSAYNRPASSKHGPAAGSERLTTQIAERIEVPATGGSGAGGALAHDDARVKKLEAASLPQPYGIFPQTQRHPC